MKGQKLQYKMNKLNLKMSSRVYIMEYKTESDYSYTVPVFSMNV